MITRAKPFVVVVPISQARVGSNSAIDTIDPVTIMVGSVVVGAAAGYLIGGVSAISLGAFAGFASLVLITRIGGRK